MATQKYIIVRDLKRSLDNGEDIDRDVIKEAEREYEVAGEILHSLNQAYWKAFKNSIYQ